MEWICCGIQQTDQKKEHNPRCESRRFRRLCSSVRWTDSTHVSSETFGRIFQGKSAKYWGHSPLKSDSEWGCPVNGFKGSPFYFDMCKFQPFNFRIYTNFYSRSHLNWFLKSPAEIWRRSNFMDSHPKIWLIQNQYRFSAEEIFYDY